MFDRILIATDDSPLMENAIKYTATIFPNADYHLINVVNTDDRSVPQTGLMQSRMAEISQEALDHGEGILEDMGIDDVKKAKPTGSPPKEILNYINQHDMGLLVMATHAKTGAQKVHIGECALHSLQITNIPSMVFACECEREKPEEIFNPTTFSKYSIDATILGMKLAKYFGASLTTYHIGKDDPGKDLERLKRRASKAGVDYDITINKGASDKTILNESRDHDFIVGSRGRSGLKYKLRRIFPSFALSDLEKELIAESKVPFLLLGE